VEQLHALGPEAGDAQQVEQPRGELGGELLAQRQLAGRDDLGDLLRQVFADPGDVGQIPGAHAHQFRDRLGEVPDGARGVAIGAHPEGVGVLDLEEIGYLVEQPRDVGVLHGGTAR